MLGSVEVDEDERATEAVVAVLGNVTVKGRVEDDVVAVLGDVHLGPHAVVTGSVTSVGGRIEQEPGAEIHGDVNEVRLRHGGWHGAGVGWRPWMDTREMFSGWFGLMGTLLRIALVMLLTLIVAIAASSPVERISRRAGSDPWVSGFVGLAAQVLFVPVLVVTVVFLAISIIGIPLLLLVPFALVALLFGVLMGFTGVARRVGEWAVGPSQGTARGDHGGRGGDHGGRGRHAHPVADPRPNGPARIRASGSSPSSSSTSRGPWVSARCC